MKPNGYILGLWGTFLVLGIILFVMQIYLARIEIKNKSMLEKIVSK